MNNTIILSLYKKSNDHEPQKKKILWL